MPKMFPEIEENLLKLIIQDDRDAFEQLFRKYYSPLCQYAYGILQTESQAEDAVQDVFIYLWENRKKLSIFSSLRSYLFTAVRHRSLRLLQKRSTEKKHDSRLKEFTEYLMSTEYSYQEEKEIEKIKGVMKELPQQCLKVFVMSSLDGKSYRDIASEMNISLNTVKSHVKKAYRIIREKTGDDTGLILLILSSKRQYF